MARSFGLHFSSRVQACLRLLKPTMFQMWFWPVRMRVTGELGHARESCLRGRAFAGRQLSLLREETLLSKQPLRLCGI